MLKKYIIEREVPGIGNNTPEGFCAIARTSNGALQKIGPDVQWLESFVVDEKTYCVYLASDEENIREHAKLSGFPATRIREVKAIIDPSTELA